MTDAVVFAPNPQLTVTIETDGGDEIHVHAGGQGVWVARMLAVLGVSPLVHLPLGGETGTVLAALLEDERLPTHIVQMRAPSAAYVHRRSGGRREELARGDGAALGRHEVDELCSATLGAAAAADVCVLTGATDEGSLTEDTYRRLASDVRALGTAVVADLCGAALRGSLAGGIDVLKVSHLELVDAGWAADDSPRELLRAMSDLHAAGARAVVVSRAEEPALAYTDAGVVEVSAPTLQEVDHRAPETR